MPATYQKAEIQSHTNIMAHLDGAQCRQHTNKLASSLTQTSLRTEIVLSVYNIPRSWYRVSHRHHSALRWCSVSATYQQVDIESHTDIVASLEGAQCPQHTNKLRSNLIQTSWRTKKVPSVLIVLSVYSIPTSWYRVSHRHHSALR